MEGAHPLYPRGGPCQNCEFTKNILSGRTRQRIFRSTSRAKTNIPRHLAKYGNASVLWWQGCCPTYVDGPAIHFTRRYFDVVTFVSFRTRGLSSGRKSYAQSRTSSPLTHVGRSELHSRSANTRNWPHPYNGSTLEGDEKVARSHPVSRMQLAAKAER